MAILLEGISVVIRTEALLEKYPGSWSAFLESVPNKTLCSDNELARVGFMRPQDAREFANKLQQAGLVFLHNGKAADLVIVDQLRGPTTPCNWLEFGQIDLNENGQVVVAGRLAGSQSSTIYFPDGWKYEYSLSASHGFVPNEDVNKNMEFLRTENEVDVFLDKTSGKIVYSGRTSDK